MAAAIDLIDQAFSRLNSRKGYIERPDQKQLALLIADCISGKASGLFEAPTGLGKSLAALIPAIAMAITENKRVVIATFTNVLAEQYWRQDLPLALSLFEGDLPKTQFLIGRQRYACLAEMQQNHPGLVRDFRRDAELGIESEFRTIINKRPRELSQIWPQISAPPVCPARLCEHYNDCFYYRARRKAEKAEIVITNHSVVMQDSLLKELSTSDLSLLGKYDFLIIDEAHDFPSAAENSLEFELSDSKLGLLMGLVNKMEVAGLPVAAESNSMTKWADRCEEFRVTLAKRQDDLKSYGTAARRSGILFASPGDVWEHPNVKSHVYPEHIEGAKVVSEAIAGDVREFLKSTSDLLEGWSKSEDIEEMADAARESMRNYSIFIQEFGERCAQLFELPDTGVSYLRQDDRETVLRQDVIGIAQVLKGILWNRGPAICMSATLALDGDFQFFKRESGMEPTFEEILPTPFDFRKQAAVYLPKSEAILDPSIARKQGLEDEYFSQMADELSKTITAMQGRTLALFHSRREMEAVYERMTISDDLPIFLQRRTGTATVGERFKKETRSSLFALRSFWTGFDAPGETLSCVAIVRVPFEVPADPAAIVRQAWLESQGLNPFRSYSLQLAKMMMRQGAGRLIRRAEDRGLVALLDPRIQSKGYGQEILENLPKEMKTFRDVVDAVAWLGLGSD